MESTGHSLILCSLDFLQEVQLRYTAQPGTVELLSHTGDLSESDLQAILNSIERTAKDNGDKPAVVKRFFSVMVESLQNLRAHGARSEQGGMATCIVVGQGDDCYYVDTGDPIKNEDVPRLQAHVEKINSMERPVLREFYMQVLANGSRSEKGGAGLGLITIALRSKNKLEMHIQPVDDHHSYLKFSFKVSRA